MSHRPLLLVLLWLLYLPLHAAEQIAYRVLAEHPHAPAAFTQGLLFHRGFLYESTGLYGQSSIRQTTIHSGAIVKESSLPRRYFGEGLALWNGNLIQLTWKEKRGFIYDIDHLSNIGSFPLRGEGWGLASTKDTLVMSDGSSVLRFLDLISLREQKRLRVTEGGNPVPNLNELEIIEGALFANILGRDQIARIDLGSGKVTGWLDLSPLRGKGNQWLGAADLNGIAWDKVSRRIFITGKRWPRLFVLSLDSEAMSKP